LARGNGGPAFCSNVVANASSPTLQNNITAPIGANFEVVVARRYFAKKMAYLGGKKRNYTLSWLLKSKSLKEKMKFTTHNKAHHLLQLGLTKIRIRKCMSIVCIVPIKIQFIVYFGLTNLPPICT